MCISALSSFNIGDQWSPIYIKDKDIHVEVINMMDYGTMNADKIIEQIKSVVE